jgi:hypothetical protein
MPLKRNERLKKLSSKSKSMLSEKKEKDSSDESKEEMGIFDDWKSMWREQPREMAEHMKC